MRESREPTPEELFYKKALNSFAMYGLKGTSSHMIAEEAGVPIPDEIELHGEKMLYREVYERSWATMLAFIQRHTEQSDDPLERFKNKFKAIWKLADDPEMNDPIRFALSWFYKCGDEDYIYTLGDAYESHGEKRFISSIDSLIHAVPEFSRDKDETLLYRRATVLANYVSVMHLTWSIYSDDTVPVSKDEAQLGAIQIARGDRDHKLG